MAEMSRDFNFDDFDAQIADALEENDQAMRPLIRRPGEIGGVALHISERSEEVPPPEAA